MRVLILVTHLLGTGHLARALTLARAFCAAGHDSTVVSGGMPAAQLDTKDLHVVQLPSLRSDGVNFTRLLDAHGAEASPRVMQARVDTLRRTLHETQPDVLITELFPFGRRVLKDEFLDVLETVSALPHKPLICASIRDILAPPSKLAKATATQDIVTRYYDMVLVHSDSEVTPLEASWPVTPALAQYLAYTGFVTRPPALQHPDRLGQDEILVSAGGGNVGMDVFRAALTAARMDPNRRWRLLVGGSDAAARIATLRPDAPDDATLDHARPEFRQMLHHAAASVSLAGYNTALDLLQAGTPSVLVPFDAGGETEQTLRAQALCRLRGMEVLPSGQLTGATLLKSVEKSIRDLRRLPKTSGLDGAENTVRLIEERTKNRHDD